MARCPCQHERDSFPHPHGEVTDRAHVFANERGTGAQVGGIGAGHSSDPPLIAANPWHHVAIVEAQDQLCAHAYRTAQPFNDPDEVDGLIARRHEVCDADPPLRCLPLGLKDQRPWPVPADGADP